MISDKRISKSKFWLAFIPLSLFLGILLRVLFVEDMEYKEDEEYNFTQTQLIGQFIPWPWYGIPSGVYIVNPGMSIWVFTILAKLFNINTPTGLARAVQIFALMGMSLILPFAWKFLKTSSEKVLWYWAFALAMVNPFLVLYQRKLWPEPFLPFFSMVLLMGWWRRDLRKGAFIWGLAGACIGQVHMSGFFLAGALFFSTFIRERFNSKTRWAGWFAGSVLGALPLVPWFLHIVQSPVAHSVSRGGNEAFQFKYWQFWLSDGLGLHLGNPLGILRGPSHWDQISDFVRYPLIAGAPTYGIGMAHGAVLICAVFIFYRGLRSLWLNRSSWKTILLGRESSTAFVQNSAFWVCGILMTATGVMIRRYYMTVTFPFEFIFLARFSDAKSKVGHRLLCALWFAELLISIGFVYYVHVNEGAIHGDYGAAYHLKPQALEY